MKGADSDVLFNCGPSQCIKECLFFDPKSLCPSAKTEKSSKDKSFL